MGDMNTSDDDEGEWWDKVGWKKWKEWKSIKRKEKSKGKGGGKGWKCENGKKSVPSNIIKHDSSNWNLIQSIQSIQLDGLLHAPIDVNIRWTHQTHKGEQKRWNNDKQKTKNNKTSHNSNETRIFNKNIMKWSCYILKSDKRTWCRGFDSLDSLDSHFFSPFSPFSLLKQDHFITSPSEVSVISRHHPSHRNNNTKTTQ